LNRRNNGNVIYSEEIDGGVKSLNRLPMTIDSITILNRLQERKRVAVEQDDHKFIQLGSGIHRLITSNDHSQQNVALSMECEQENESFQLDDEEEDNNSLKTLNTDTKSYNTSAQQCLKEIFSNLHRKKKRMARSLAEHGKRKQKRKKYKQKSKVFINSIDMKSSFFNNLFLLRQNRRKKTMIIMKKKNSIKSIKAKNLNSNSNRNNQKSIDNLSCNLSIHNQLNRILFFL
jgi:hypothetical protein